MSITPFTISKDHTHSLINAKSDLKHLVNVPLRQRKLCLTFRTVCLQSYDIDNRSDLQVIASYMLMNLDL